MGEVIAFVSGKGGTGKSALCAAVATALAADGKKVLCIDTDVGLRNLDTFLGLSSFSVLSFEDICRGDHPLSAALVHPSYPTLSFLTAPANARPIDAAALETMLKKARKSFDFILLDGAAGLGAAAMAVSKAADRTVVVTLPDPASLRCCRRMAEELEKSGISKAQLVVNRLYKDLLRALKLNVDDMMDQVGLPLLGIVPSDPHISFAAARDIPLLQYSRGGAVPACKRIAQRLQGRSVPVANR